MKRLGLLILFCCGLHTVRAQFQEFIRSSRPSQSIGASTVGMGVFQLQTGFDHFGDNNQSNNSSGSGYLTNTGLRYGLTEKFELGGLFEYKTQSVTTNGVTERYQGLSNLLIGVRHQVLVGNEHLPSIGVQLRFRLPVLSDDYKIDHLAPALLVAASQQISKSFLFLTNLGVSWNGIDGTSTFNYTLNLSYAFTDTFGAFIENYGNSSKGVFETRMDTGVALLVIKDIQLDLSGGYGVNHGINDYFVSTGISWRSRRKAQGGG